MSISPPLQLAYTYLVHDGHGEVRLVAQGVALRAQLALPQEFVARNNDSFYAGHHLRGAQRLVKTCRHLPAQSEAVMRMQKKSGTLVTCWTEREGPRSK